jgi:hypothetical protein
MIKLAYDFNPGAGGAIKRDRLWFYASARFLKNSNYIAGSSTTRTPAIPMPGTSPM